MTKVLEEGGVIYLDDGLIALEVASIGEHIFQIWYEKINNLLAQEV